MKKAFLVYPHQLFEDISTMKGADVVILVEEPLFFSEFPFHKQKLMLHRASMKAYQDYLQRKEVNTIYIEFHLMEQTSSIATVLLQRHIGSVEMYDPIDDWLSSRLADACTLHNITLDVIDTPLFLTKPADLKTYFANRTGARKYFMNDFYSWQRKRLEILVEGEKPVGGAWSFDKENRKKLPKDIRISS